MEESTASAMTASGFWAHQKQAWLSLGRWTRQAYRNRRGGFVATVAAVLALPTGSGLLLWPNNDDIRITSLDNSKSESIPRCLPSLKGSGTLAKGHHLWIAVEFPDKTGNNRVLFLREATIRRGHWHADQFNVGGAGHEGNSYTLTALDVDGPTHTMLSTAVIDMYKTNAETLPAGADLWRFSSHGYPTGAQPRDEVNVSRGHDQRSCAEIADELKPKL
ncbi:hypothetical protein [Streptomyces bauhiniae]|uniref:hypothetical protein n=1 Tax=Streptomyces bauhiniae TaxID=2340725 RepID=UPI001FCABBF9|nr:hypothetical protein [Streptomyces bauhiniae]